MQTTPSAHRKDHTVDGNLQPAPLPPPSAPEPSVTPIMPQAGSNARPHVAGAAPAAYLAPPAARRRRSRTRVYTIGAVVFLALSIAGYIGFRQYIYGDDAPPVPVLDDIGG